MKNVLVLLIFFSLCACGDSLKKKDGSDNNGEVASNNISIFPKKGCGNAIIESGEDCDGPLTQMCASIGFAGGAMSCSADCKFDTSQCQALDTCQNGELDDAETCDGIEFRGQTCASLGFVSGSLKCTSQCTLDATSCRNGNGGGSTCAAAYDNFVDKCEDNENFVFDPADRDQAIADCDNGPDNEAQLACALGPDCEAIIDCLVQLNGE